MTTPVCVRRRIRQLDRQGLSHREISRKLGVSRTTVARYADHGDYSPKPLGSGHAGRSLVDAGYSAVVDGWLTADLRMPADWGRAQLETLDFVDRCEDLVLYGPVGTGKTHLAVALGRLACMRAIPVRFFTATGLLMRLRRAKREDRLDTELRQIAKARLLIIDEFGYMPIDEEGSRLLFQVISDSYETRSVVYTTNIEFSGWRRVLGDKNMAAALIDRTVHHGRLAGFEGGSYRSEHALMTR